MAETQSLAGILAAVALPNLGGITGGYFAKKAGKNYSRSLKRPWYTPPDWVYGPVWAGLCSGIGYASYLVYKDGGGFDGPARLPLMAYGVNLAIYWSWPPIYFYMKRLDLAFYNIILLDASMALTGYLFYQINKTAGYLFIPYATWLSLATLISYRIYKDNPRKMKISGN